MLRLARLLRAEGERKFTQPGTMATLNATGGLPFYGNIYVGRVESQNYTPPAADGGSGLIDPSRAFWWKDPVLQAKIEKCPYFALCDQVVWHNMDPVYLDPGLLTQQEHHLLLLFSRAYYEKWKTIHQRPANPLPRIRLKYGSTVILRELMELLEIPAKKQRTLIKEFQLDDASLIAMNPELWSTAYLDPFNMDHFSGRVLEFAEVDEPQREKFYRVLEQMRRLVVVRNDTEEKEKLVIPFSEGVTLYDLYKRLGLDPYNGQLKVYDYIDERGTQTVITLSEEDNYFDFLVTSFLKADLRNATIADFADENDYTTRYTITVEPFTVAERRVGRWF